MNILRCRLWLFLIPFASLCALAQDKTEPVIDAGKTRLVENQKSQENVSSTHEKTQNIVDSYQNLLKVVDGLNIYNRILARQLENQEAEISSLNASIANAAVIERQILPLLTRMLDGLDEFVRLDIPFNMEERENRIKSLRRLIERSELSNAEKTRRVFEAFQIENDYGNTIESYKGKLDIKDKTFDVDYLRVGRVGLMYRTVGGDSYGYWDKNSDSWQEISTSNYQRNIDKGIKMARQEMAPELITIPLVKGKASS